MRFDQDYPQKTPTTNANRDGNNSRNEASNGQLPSNNATTPGTTSNPKTEEPSKSTTNRPTVKAQAGIPQCTHCNRFAHSENECWVKHPHLSPFRNFGSPRPSPEAKANTIQGVNTQWYTQDFRQMAAYPRRYSP